MESNFLVYNFDFESDAWSVAGEDPKSWPLKNGLDIWIAEWTCRSFFGYVLMTQKVTKASKKQFE